MPRALESIPPFEKTMFWGRALEISKIAGLVALIAAFPPVFFTSVTMREGMRISFGLLLFYLARGFVGMASLVSSRRRKSVLFLRTVRSRLCNPVVPEPIATVSRGAYFRWRYLGLPSLDSAKDRRSVRVCLACCWAGDDSLGRGRCDGDHSPDRAAVWRANCRFVAPCQGKDATKYARLYFSWDVWQHTVFPLGRPSTHCVGTTESVHWMFFQARP